MAMQDVFTKIFEDNKWAGSQSGSGPGSALHTTATVREALPGIVRDYGIKVLLDAPCGDYNWMLSTEDLGVERYIGVDVVPAIIEANQAHIGPGVQFLTADLTADPLPRADLVLCRDCLVHFTEEQIGDAVRNLRDSGTEYLLTTTFFSLTENRPGSTGGWRPINLQVAPFSWPEPLALIHEREYDAEKAYSDKSLGLWRLADLPG